MRGARLGLWLELGMTLLLASVVSQQLLPNQPAGFASRGSSPFLAYSFRQSECATGVISSDVATTALLLTLQGSGITSCPSRNAFENGIIGVSINASRSQERNALVTAKIGNALNSVTNPAGGAKAFSVEVWFSFTSSAVDGEINTLIEIGGLTGTSDAVGALPEETHFRITYRRFTSGNDQLSIDYVVQTEAAPDPPTPVGPVPRNAGGLGSTAQYNTNLEAVGNSAVGSIHLLVVTIGTDNSVSAHVGPAGGVLGTFPGAAVTNTRNYIFPNDTAVVRIGCTRSPTGGSAPLRNFPGTIHFAAFYNTALSQSTVSSMLAAGLPNSNPAVRAGDVAINEDASGIVNMNLLVFDFENNPISRFRIRSRPTNGALTYNLAALPSFGDFVVTDVNLLRYQQTTPNVFSVISGTTCATAFDSFTFDASDGLCDRTDTPIDDPKCNSVRNGTARICIVDTQDLPTGIDLQPADVRSGNNRSIVLDPIDLDDRNGTSDNLPSTFRSHEPPFVNGVLSTNVAVQFNVTSGTFGRMEFFNAAGTACNGTQVPNDTMTWIPATPGARNFQLCYQAFPSTPQPPPGFDTFHYRFRDRGMGVGPYSKITIRVINPIEACPALSQVPAPLERSCESSGDETTVATDERLIPVYLTGSDTLIRPLRFVLSSLPSYGKLYIATGTAPNFGKGALVATNAEYAATPQNTFAMVYVGNVGFFTRFNVSTENFWRYANWEGRGIDGCAGSGASSCRCASNVAPGCPDSFRYAVRAGPGQSDDGTYNIQVNGRPSPYTVTRPFSFAYSRTARFNFVGTSAIVIQDSDDDTYNMTGRFNPTPGRLGTSILGLSGRIFTIETYDCLENGCNSLIEFWGTPTALNTMLSRLFFANLGSVVGNETVLALNFYKALPSGTTPQNAATVYQLGPSRVITQEVSIFILNAAGDSGGSANTLDIAIYAGAGAAGFLAIICCLNACVWFMRKSRKAAKAVRKSMASTRRSQSGRQSQQQHVMMDDDLEDKRSRSDAGAGGAAAAIIGMFCCIGRDRDDDDDDDRRAQHAALAQQRQSVASQHSVRSHASQHRSQRQSQGAGMVAYQHQPPAFAEPPSKGREMVAPSVDGTEATVADDSVFAWEKHIDRRTGDVYFFNPRTGVSQWDPPTIKVKRTGK